ncbi:hypothetical protein FSARC_5053 [Fusarium sarcochroum]|uniref:Glycosyltransferase family 28 N-terminal domain-containing protein n=1 Tax=Fusarium sarcochroum TaxID=1208366 RepID=A0A8H4U084_9HYPO|nr:hypothetical protein FSARC_5053 [Fusarium sarcochroum]
MALTNSVAHEAVQAIDTCARDDGRIDVHVPPALSQRLSKIPNLEDIDSHPEQPSPPYTPRHQPVIPLNILIQVVGSRGDIQPFIALANELQVHKHRVRLATHDVFADFVASSGVEFFPVGGDPSELMAYMVKNPGLIPSLDSLCAGDIQSKREMMARILDGFWSSCIQPDPKTGDPFVADCIIANPPSFAHIHCAQALGVPLHMMFTMPWTSTGAFPHPLANVTSPSSGSEREVANYLSYSVVEFMTWQGLGDLVNEWRQAKLGLERVPLNEGHRLLKSLQIPFTYCWSPSLIPKPREWGSKISISGFFFRNQPSYKPPENLDAFLQSGPMPIYIGFGSIVVGDPDRLMTMVLKAVKVLGVRAIISKGWSELKGDENPNVFYVSDCPHEWLFQQVSAVVHHGGAGTTACGLLMGRPTVVVSFFGEHQSNPIFIESRRWDPITAAGSASIEAAATMADATVDIFSKPYNTIKQRHTRPETLSNGESSQDASSSDTRDTNHSGVTTDVIRGSTKGLGILALTSAKGILVDIPVAVTDGLLAVPHLYGEDVRRRGNIDGFRAGAVVAGKNFYHGMFEAITDIAIYTYHGKREENAIGAAKGLGKGLLSLVTKSTAATIGLVAYPAQGLQRTIRDTLVTSVPKAIQNAVRTEGDWILERNPASDEEIRCAEADFTTLCGANV